MTQTIIISSLIALTSCVSTHPGQLGYDIGKEKLYAGKACKYIWLWFIPYSQYFLAYGENTIYAARKVGQLKRVAFYDTETHTNILWKTNCTIAYGEKNKSGKKKKKVKKSKKG